MQLSSQFCITPASDASALRFALDSESLIADEVSPSDLTRQEKGFFDPAFQTLLSEANRELTALLREVHTLARQRQLRTFVECILPIIDKHLAGRVAR